MEQFGRMEYCEKSTILDQLFQRTNYNKIRTLQMFGERDRERGHRPNNPTRKSRRMHERERKQKIRFAEVRNRPKDGGARLCGWVDKYRSRQKATVDSHISNDVS
ncbi:hypothetical protein JTB14_025307 [Gonioctena quinquepunctata]|nr:hypothetical protein JTB14_025307 [Gonioctena quinquepunctata]